MSLQTLKRRVQKLESACAQKEQHVVIVFSSTPEADANADRLIEEGRAEAERLGKKLRVLRVGWIREDTPCTEALCHLAQPD
jgi:regulator of protease activity HflC (stomatin/prohibitin superfamily)